MSLKERINLVKQQFGISEADTLNIEKALGKKLVDYESIEALVAALMGYYNGELKKKANTSHTHDYAPSSHKHKKADISDFPTSIKNPNALEIKMNGQNPVSYDGAAAKSINITASGIGAEPAFKKNGAFNKNFGTTSNTVLEGAKLAEILGLTYGGSLNTSSAKTVNYAYYDSTTKKVYKCIKATSINYADANYFEAISNNDLLGKLQNLGDINKNTIGHFTDITGIKFCWGTTGTLSASSNTLITFSEAFKEKVFSIQATILSNSGIAGNKSDYVFVNSITLSNFKLKIGSDYGFAVSWLAIGY